MAYPGGLGAMVQFFNDLTNGHRPILFSCVNCYIKSDDQGLIVLLSSISEI